jgi:hypothetical protein
LTPHSTDVLVYRWTGKKHVCLDLTGVLQWDRQLQRCFKHNDQI